MEDNGATFAPPLQHQRLLHRHFPQNNRSFLPGFRENYLAKGAWWSSHSQMLLHKHRVKTSLPVKYISRGLPFLPIHVWTKARHYQRWQLALPGHFQQCKPCKLLRRPVRFDVLPLCSLCELNKYSLQPPQLAPIRRRLSKAAGFRSVYFIKTYTGMMYRS